MKLFKDKKLESWIMAVIWIVIWMLASYFLGSEFIMPSPAATVKALMSLLVTADFWMDVLWTGLRVILTIVFSFALGVIAASLSSRNDIIRDFLRIPVNFFKSIPVMAIIIYVILVVKSDWVAVVVGFLMCFPIVYTNMYNGLKGLDPKQLELGWSLGLPRPKMLRFIIIPALNPQIKTSMSLIAAMSWKVVVASEVLAIPNHSIGYEMLNSKYYLNTADLFAYIIVLIVLSLVLEYGVDRLTDLHAGRLSNALERAVETSPKESGMDYGVCLIELKDVDKTYVNADGECTQVFKGFNASFGPGVTAVLAPSGRGKTTLADMIEGLEQPDSGEITYGTDKVRAAYLFQEDRLLPWFNVRDNMLLASVGSNLHENPMEDLLEMAEKLEIRDALSLMPDELSGGMAHRVALGRTLLYGGNVLILDEPFRGLDQDTRDRLMERLYGELKRDPSGDEEGSFLFRTVILITHDEDLAERLFDREIRL